MKVTDKQIKIGHGLKADDATTVLELRVDWVDTLHAHHLEFSRK